MSDTLIEYRLTPDAEFLLKSGNIPDFATLCGDRFIAARTTGGLLRAVIEYHAQTKDEQKTIEAAVSGGYASFSVAAKFSEALQLATSNIKHKAYLIQEGGNPSVIPTTIPDVIKAATIFPASVSGANTKNAWVTSVTLMDYGVGLPPLPKKVLSLQKELYNLKRMAKAYSDLRVRLADIRNLRQWTSNPDCEKYLASVDLILDKYTKQLFAIADSCTEELNCSTVAVPPQPHIDPLPSSCAPVSECKKPIKELATPRPVGFREEFECMGLKPGDRVRVRLEGKIVARNRPSDHKTWVCMALDGRNACNDSSFGCPPTQHGCSGQPGERPLSLLALDTIETVPNDGIIRPALSLGRCEAAVDHSTQCSIQDGTIVVEVLPKK